MALLEQEVGRIDAALSANDQKITALANEIAELVKRLRTELTEVEQQLKRASLGAKGDIVVEVAGLAFLLSE